MPSETTSTTAVSPQKTCGHYFSYADTVLDISSKVVSLVSSGFSKLIIDIRYLTKIPYLISPHHTHYITSYPPDILNFSDTQIVVSYPLSITLLKLIK